SQYARRTRPGSGIANLLDRTLENADLKPNSLIQYENVAERIKKAFQEFEPDQVRPTHIAQFLDHHRKTPSMANRVRSVLKLTFANGVRWGKCEMNPVNDIKPFKEKGRDRYLTDDEYLAIRSQGRPYLKLMMDLPT
ncbi:MAG: integrase, partial [Gammaproteobacteria bacterium]|nr:integrase [Gammaproteobacteria bacterium]